MLVKSLVGRGVGLVSKEVGAVADAFDTVRYPGGHGSR